MATAIINSISKATKNSKRPTSPKIATNLPNVTFAAGSARGRPRSVGAGSATDVTSPMDSSSVGGGTASGTLVDAPVYPHTTTFESDQMAITVSSPHQEFTFPNGNDGAIVKLPVFSAKDNIGGTISVNPAAYPNSSNAKIVVSLEGALYWSEPRPVESTTTYNIGSTRRRSTKDSISFAAQKLNLPTQNNQNANLNPNIERKHVFLYSALNLPLGDDDGLSGAGSTSPNALDTIMYNKQQALAAVRRRMSYGRAEASKLLERARRKKSAGNVEEIILPGQGSLPGSASGSTANIAALFKSNDGGGNSPESAPNTPDPMLTATPWIMKTFMFQLPLKQKDGSAALLPPSVDLRAEAAEHEKGRTKLAENVRIQYKLVARYESGLLSLAKHLEVPIIFEPGSDADSFYATPQPPIKWRETPMELIENPNEGQIPFRAMLTLPNPPVFARDSESFFFVAFSTTPHDKALSALIASNAKISLNITCTYRFDQRRAAAHSSRSTGEIGQSSTTSKDETIWKWREPPASPLKRTSSSKKAKWEAAANSTHAGSQQTTIRRLTGGSIKENGGEEGEFGEKPLPGLPPSSPTSDTGSGGIRRSGDIRRSGEVDGDEDGEGPITTPPPKVGEEDKLGETTVTLLSTSRTGFPHRPKLKSDQSNLPEGLWKGQLNYQWWMIPTLDWAGLSVKYHMEVAVEIDGTVLKTRKEFRIVEPHTVRKEEKIPPIKRVEVDGVV